MLKIRISSYAEDGSAFLRILKELARINAIKIIEQSKSYPNRGNSLVQRSYLDIEVNPQIFTLEAIEDAKNRTNTQ